MPEQTGLFECNRQHIRDEWIDYNGHFNMGYYGVLFDICSDDAFAAMGLGPKYLSSGFSFYTLEAHITYLREMHAGNPVRVMFRVMDFDAKRIHYFQEMYHAEEGWLAATLEGICMHIDMSVTKSAPFPEDILSRIDAMYHQHKALPVPPQVGHQIGIVRKSG